MQKLKPNTIKKLASALDYEFKDIEHLHLSLTHKSMSGLNNERLEFLGDSVLNFAISSEIYSKFSDLDEGSLTRIRSSLVSRESLADLAKDLDLGKDIILSASEKAAGGYQRTSILANGLESIFGAVYIDSNIDTAKKVILHLYKNKINEVIKSGGVGKDAKTLLQEWIQSKEHSLPEYEVTDIKGKAHQQIFVVECKVLDIMVTADGSSRRKAEQSAAAKVLEIIKQKYKD